MVFAPTKPLKLPYITHLATFPSQNSPTNSVDEAKKQEQVRQAIATDEPLRKHQAIRQLIDRIVVEWATEPSKDRRHKSGVRTFCKSVRVIGTDGNETPIMTNETPSV